MDLGFESIIQIALVALCVFVGLKVTGKIIKFFMFVGVVIFAVWFLLDAGVISV